MNTRAGPPGDWAAQPERGSDALLQAAVRVVFALGWPLGRALLWPIAGWFWATTPTARAASRDYLGRVLGGPVRAVHVLRHIHAFAAAILDRIYLAAGRHAGFRIATAGLEHLTAALAGGRGCVLLGAHLGSFEALRVFGQSSPVAVRAVMHRRNAGALTRLLDRLDPAGRAAVIEIGDPASMLAAREALERGEILGLLADRAPAGSRMVAAPFFGRPAAFPAGPLLLAAALGAPVVLCRAVRTGPRRYAIGFEPFAERLSIGRGARRDDDLRHHIGRYAAALERACRAHPFEWFNFYPFWQGAEHAGADRDGPAGDVAAAAAGAGARLAAASGPASTDARRA